MPGGSDLPILNPGQNDSCLLGSREWMFEDGLFQTCKSVFLLFYDLQMNVLFENVCKINQII